MTGPLDVPMLSRAQYDALRANIEANGVTDPIVVDAATGEIVDGRARQAIAAQLGIPCPSTRRQFPNATSAWLHRMTVNMTRIPAPARARIVDELLMAGMTTHDIRQITGTPAVSIHHQATRLASRRMSGSSRW